MVGTSALADAGPGVGPGLTVSAKEHVAEGVVSLTLTHPGGARLPDWTPGSHIDLVLPDGTTRQYSLCGDRWDAHTYRIAVLREPAGRGGSAQVHDRLRPGDRVGVGGPRSRPRSGPTPVPRPRAATPSSASPSTSTAAPTWTRWAEDWAVPNGPSTTPSWRAPCARHSSRTIGTRHSSRRLTRPHRPPHRAESALSARCGLARPDGVPPRCLTGTPHRGRPASRGRVSRLLRCSRCPVRYAARARTAARAMRVQTAPQPTWT